MCIIDLLSIRENLDQEEHSSPLAPEVPRYEGLQMPNQEINYFRLC